MILQRLATSIRKQDWFTVLIETLIVVLGVFIGLQVNNWNETRRERAFEAQIMERLNNEVPALIATRSAERGFTAHRKAALDTALVKLFAPGSDEELTDMECLAIALSHIYPRSPDDLTVLDELKSTGRIDIIRDANIRAALSGFVLARDEGRSTQSAVSIDLHQLPAEFHDLLQSSFEPAPGESLEDADASYSCDTAGMRQDRAFLTKLVINRQRLKTYFKTEFEDVDATLQTLRVAISGERGQTAR
ncbi:hypothetical protein WNY37_16890 [Henriciella sp. AS95]|uniref:hypothetical protein n=1 Tax=Henriciella sp. AS95 TaxID=3135782 RepID=UPI0031756AEC